MQNPMSIFNVALPSIRFTVAHVRFDHQVLAHIPQRSIHGSYHNSMLSGILVVLGTWAVKPECRT